PPAEPEQYTSVMFTESLALQGLSASIGSVGDDYDNALAESIMEFRQCACRAEHRMIAGLLAAAATERCQQVRANQAVA
ncbi:hypothetical protein AB0F79_24480, partial [Nocardia fluminea]